MPLVTAEHLQIPTQKVQSSSGRIMQICYPLKAEFKPMPVDVSTDMPHQQAAVFGRIIYQLGLKSREQKLKLQLVSLGPRKTFPDKCCPLGNLLGTFQEHSGTMCFFPNLWFSFHFPFREPSGKLPGQCGSSTLSKHHSTWGKTHNTLTPT